MLSIERRVLLMYIEKYIQDLNELTKDEKQLELVFRGQPGDWKTISSSASRRMQKNKQSTTQSDFIKYHKILLKNVRENGYILPDNPNANLKDLNDLELLANIQHMGGATCLTDFTTNFLVALWFAASSSLDDKDGTVFVINLKSSENRNLFKKIIDESDDIDKILTYKAECQDEIIRKKHFWVWKPEKYKYNKRICNQNSVFIFGLPPMNICKVIKIPMADKIKIRRELKEYYNIDIDFLFPDFNGFSSSVNNPDSLFNYFFCHDCIDIACDYLEDNHFNDSNRYLDKFIICKKNSELVCKRRQGEPCKNNLDDAYFYKGECLYQSTKKDTDYCLRTADKMDIYEYNDKIETLCKTFIEAISYFEKLINSTEYSTDSFNRILDIYYDTLKFDKNDFSNVACKCEMIINDNNEHIYESNNYVYFSLIELAILSDNPSKFKELMAKVNNLNELKKEVFLINYFDCIGKLIWDNDFCAAKEYIKKLDEQIAKIQKAIQNNNCEIGKFKVELSRNFDDILFWANRDFNRKKAYCGDLLKLTKKMKTLQDVWTEYSYCLEDVTLDT